MDKLGIINNLNLLSMKKKNWNNMNNMNNNNKNNNISRNKNKYNILVKIMKYFQVKI